VWNAPVWLIVPDRRGSLIRPPETVMDMVPELLQPGEAVAVHFPSYLATPPSLPPRREDDPVSALGDDFFVDRILRGASSSPVTDLSVFPIAPPVLPGCNCATQGTESIQMKKMDKMKRGIGIPHRP
jgi:hypothetical protein